MSSFYDFYQLRWRTVAVSGHNDARQWPLQQLLA